jgi:hypothetical protein
VRQHHAKAAATQVHIEKCIKGNLHGLDCCSVPGNAYGTFSFCFHIGPVDRCYDLHLTSKEAGIRDTKRLSQGPIQILLPQILSRFSCSQPSCSLPSFPSFLLFNSTWNFFFSWHYHGVGVHSPGLLVSLSLSLCRMTYGLPSCVGMLSPTVVCLSHI